MEILANIRAIFDRFINDEENQEQQESKDFKSKYSVVTIVNLYIDGSLSHKAIEDYIELLNDDISSLRNLLYIDRTISSMDPCIKRAVNKAKMTKFWWLINALKLNDDRHTINDNVIYVDFNNMNKN